MLVMTERFGELDVAEEAVIHFPEGILGFDQLHRYILIQRDQEGPIQFLQAIDDPAVAFAVMDPNEFRPDYSPQLWDEDRMALDCHGKVELKVFSILTVPQDVRELTANLMAPVVINAGRRLGRQVVQRLGEYSTQHRILDEIERAQRLLLAPIRTASPQSSRETQLSVPLRKSV